VTAPPVGVVLYGPPASGKDTITTTLNRLDPRFRLLRKLKVGTGRGDGYTFITPERLEELRDTGRLAVETHRYGNIYAIDRADIEAMTAAGIVPVAHMGNIADLRRLVGPTPDGWLRVLLWVPREVTELRSKERGDVDTERRLNAWDETRADLDAHTDEGFFHLRIRTDRLDAETAATEIMRAFRSLTNSAALHAVPHRREDVPAHRRG
jgi:guanylate kinase